VVDDEESIRSVVAAALTRHGYQVTTASDGADAVAHYAKLGAKVRAVITDIDMPIMDGVTMIKVMKRLNPDLRVLVSSGLASSGRIEARKRELEALGVDSILVKPYTTEKILRALHALLTK
jgi:CheY-like chemotaxis protein